MLRIFLFYLLRITDAGFQWPDTDCRIPDGGAGEKGGQGEQGMGLEGEWGAGRMNHILMCHLTCFN